MRQYTVRYFIEKYYEHSIEKIVFADDNGKIIAMNDAVKDILSEEDNYSAVANAICHRCEGYTNAYDVQSCKDCFLESMQSTSYEFPSIYEDERSKVMPFTATYQLIDQDREFMHLRFKMFHHKLNSKRNYINNV